MMKAEYGYSLGYLKVNKVEWQLCRKKGSPGVRKHGYCVAGMMKWTFKCVVIIANYKDFYFLYIYYSIYRVSQNSF